jgi:5,10-methylenetetrahydrofolate reductase
MLSSLEMVCCRQGGGCERGVRKPLLCVEVNPPRGTDVSSVLARYAGLQGVDCVNVTDSALAKMRLSALTFAALFKQHTGIEPLVNVACRDRNVIALQSELLGAWALGVRSIVALTGDAVTVGDLPDAKGVFELNSIGLLQLVATLNGGRDLAGVELKGHPEFVAGVVVNPNARNRDAELRRLERKRQAGATYALSQPVFDAVQARAFFESAAGIGIDLMVGVMPFRSAHAFGAIRKVPGIKISDELVARVGGVLDAAVPELSCTIAGEVVEAARPFVRGFHIVSGGAPLLALELCERVASRIEEWSAQPSLATAALENSTALAPESGA